jgi:hypothetical protein
MFENDITYVRYLTDIKEELAKINNIAIVITLPAEELLADEMDMYYLLY